MTKVGLIQSLIMEHKSKKQEHKLYKISSNITFYYENVKITKPGYGTRLYLKLLFNKLNVTWSYLYLYIIRDLVQGKISQNIAH
jgi:hypothetical protein